MSYKNMSYPKLVVVFFLIVILATPMAVLASGIIVAPDNYYVWETSQKAVIFYEAGKETLVLSIGFQGNAKDFAWMIPTPSRPTASKATYEIFSSLEDLTTPVYDYPRPMPLLAPGDELADDRDVRLVDSRQIEYYQIDVLAAGSVDSLIGWLEKNGYSYPETAGYLLEDYISNGWYFTAVKINDEYLSDNIEGQLRSGQAVPLRLDFLSEKMVYPMKISSILASEDWVPRRYSPYHQVGVTIYVIAENKQELPKFITTYAGWIEREVIENLAYNDDGSSWMTPDSDRYFLTKLTRYMSRAEMTNDLYLRQTKDNSTINAPSEIVYRGWVGFIAVMAGGALLMLVLLIVLIWLNRKRN